MIISCIFNFILKSSLLTKGSQKCERKRVKTNKNYKEKEKSIYHVNMLKLFGTYLVAWLLAFLQNKTREVDDGTFQMLLFRHFLLFYILLKCDV